MKSDVQENVDALSRAILSEAQAEADKIVADTRAKAEQTRQQAQEKAAAVRKDILDRASEEANQLRSQAVATTQLKSRTMQLAHREQLLNNVFNTAQQDLPTIQQWTDYDEIAENLLREAVPQLHSREVQIRADKRTQAVYTQQFLDNLSREMNVQIKLGPPLENGTGVIVEADNGHLQFDNTLETRLSRMQNDLRSPVYHILMGEAL